MFQTGDYIYHPEYGVGEILSVQVGEEPEATAAFQGRPPVTFTYTLLQRGAEKLSPQGFRALAHRDPELAQKLVDTDMVEVVARALDDFPGYKTKTEDLKDYLTPYVTNWETWWKKTQLRLKDDPRIDTSQSYLREYALARELRSPAEEAYLTFHSQRRKLASTAELVDRARAALNQHRKDSGLPPEHLQDLVDYLWKVVNLDSSLVALRVGTLFYLREDNWVPRSQTEPVLERLIQQDFWVYELDLFSQPRLLAYLKSQPFTRRAAVLLASGICAGKSAIQDLQQWAMRKGDAKIVAALIVAALSQNLPPEMDKERLPEFQARLDACRELARGLPANAPAWPEVFKAYHKASISFTLVDIDEVRALLPSFLSLGRYFHQRAVSQGSGQILESLVGKDVPLRFILAVLDTGRNIASLRDFRAILLECFLNSADQRKDNFLAPFVDALSPEPLEQARLLVDITFRNASPTLLDLAGNTLCEIARQATDHELVDIIPALNYFHAKPGEWLWQAALEGLREKAYFELLNRGRLGAQGYQDAAILSAAESWRDEALAQLQEQINHEKQQREQIQRQLLALQGELKEKETLLRELRGGVGGDVDAARFEERTRIMKELVSTLAEFERYAAGLSAPANELESMIRRISSQLNAYRVIPQEQPGTRLSYSPQKHQLIEGKNLAAGQEVVVAERGYLIRDPADRLRLLKPAIVRPVS